MAKSGKQKSANDTTTSKKYMLIFGLLLITVGLAFGVFTITSSFSNWRIQILGTKTTGTVIDYEVTDDHSGSKIFYCPVVSFMDTDGKTIKFKSSRCSGGCADNPIGSNVDVAYPNDSPKDAIMVGTWYTIGEIFFVVTGALAIYFGVILIYSSLQASNSRKDIVKSKHIL